MRRFNYILVAVLFAHLVGCTGSSPVYPETPSDPDPVPVEPQPLPAGPQDPDSLALMDADWTWIDIMDGRAEAGCASMTLFGKPEYISVIRYPMAGFRTSLVDSQMERAATTSSIAKANGGAIAINGSYFNTTTLAHNSFFSLYGQILGQTSTGEYSFRSNGFLAISENGRKIDISTYELSQCLELASRYDEVIATGPVLLDDGVDVSALREESTYSIAAHPRTLFGTDARGWVWMIVIDGRFPGFAEGATIVECTKVCRFFGLTDAINFDGGGSSTLWSVETGILNHPYDNKVWDHNGERKVPNIVMAKPVD